MNGNAERRDRIDAALKGVWSDFDHTRETAAGQFARASLEVRQELAACLLDEGTATDQPVYVTLAELFAKPELLEPPEAVIPRLAYRGRLVILAGPDKSGKSTLLGCAAAELSQGGVFLGKTLEKGGVVWCGLEEAPGDAVRRFHEMGAHGANVMLVKPAPANLLSATRELLAEWPTDVMVIDSLQEYARVVTDTVPDDGDAAGWATVVRPLAALARKFDVAVVVLHHVRKSDGQYRGSTEIAAAADALLELTMPTAGEDPTIRHIRGRGRWHVGAFDVAFRDGRYEMAGGGELSLDALLLIHVKESPGISLAGLTKLAGKRKQTVVETLGQLEDRGAIEHRGTGSQAGYYLPSPQHRLEAV